MFSECEKRQYDRINISLPVIIETGNGFLEGEITNISAGGAFVICGNSIRIAERIYMAIANIPEINRHVPVKAELIWKNTFRSNGEILSQGLAVQFTKISEINKEVILTLVSNGSEE